MIEKVTASKISNKKVYYNCDHCGKTHSHGVGETDMNMTALVDSVLIPRGCHCISMGSPTDVLIQVDERTKKIHSR